MSDLGVYASRLSTNSKSLKEFEEALRFFVGKPQTAEASDVLRLVEKLLEVVNPVSQSIEGNLSESTAIDEHNVVDILRNRHDREWSAYKERIVQLNSKLHSESFHLSKNDFQLLNDIADALDAECANLFRRMSGR